MTDDLLIPDTTHSGTAYHGRVITLDESIIPGTVDLPRWECRHHHTTPERALACAQEAIAYGHADQPIAPARDLPHAEPQYPLCGVCLGDLESDGDTLYCEACRLDYDPDTFAPTYRYHDDMACRVTQPDSLHPGPCVLPLRHTGPHYPGQDS